MQPGANMRKLRAHAARPREQLRPGAVVHDTKQETNMFKFLGGAVGIIFLIGLLVVIGIFSLIF